ncbi:hypothetical protein CLF_103254 [Clonorchis sinensis]|uniref:PH domain-containing protein n=1 Tax=Clonorchis sinensis TaxID=79923 RepID=G7Y9E7_CLOSI|nr:hypothetical protein CLF_103254 [Clonorchis sinensis]
MVLHSTNHSFKITHYSVRSTLLMIPNSNDAAIHWFSVLQHMSIAVHNLASLESARSTELTDLISPFFCRYSTTRPVVVLVENRVQTGDSTTSPPKMRNSR